METKKILKYRDAWMGLAILWVMIYHSRMPLLDSVPQVLNYIWGGVKTFGFGGVDIFIFASGIGCFYSLSKNCDILHFIKRRAIRILPTYEVFIFIWIIVHMVFNSMPYRAIIGNIFCIQNFTCNSNEFNWYISAIWLMYFLAPFFWEYINKFDNEKHIKSMGIIFLLLIISTAFWNSHTFIITVSRIPLFYLGMLFAKYTCMNNFITFKKCMYMLFLMVVNNPAGMTPLFQPEETAIPIHGNRYSSSRTPPFQL